MNKKEVIRITSFLREVEELPNEILTEEEFNLYLSGEEGRVLIENKQADLLNKVRNLKLRLLGYFRALDGDQAVYVDLLGTITFRPKDFIFNTGHYQNSQAWLNDKGKLINLLIMAKAEIEEKARIAKDSPENSIWALLKSKEVKILVFSTLLGGVGWLGTVIYTNITERKPAINQVENSVQDKSTAEDRALVLDKTTREVLTNYYQTVQSLREKYSSISAEDYIKEYLEEETRNIGTRIKNRSYIHRFAKNENLWQASDYNEMATLLLARTVGRMKEISEDIESTSKGPFTLTEDRLKALEEQLKNEIAK
ncbi:hypothetical protein [Pedobacter sp. GR22-10]|uniref:hypothetical protein n=1 Tax=Pedobacter sp. GR22-10 TaxID=2994472 RepID=UPI0022452DBF|nr:hypothetical protein [Pedobacter sp. GR22-10]MCX2429906.1 hypothetical protein [Pedobacter sp. GR22-10]